MGSDIWPQVSGPVESSGRGGKFKTLCPSEGHSDKSQLKPGVAMWECQSSGNHLFISKETENLDSLYAIS